MVYFFALGNDCAVAIAEHIGKDLDGFASIMNNKAKELGLSNSHFVTPHGLDNQDHYTTAYELALVTNYALKNDTFRKIVSTKRIQICDGTKDIYNTNELLGNYQGVYGVKTGFTFGAGRCLVTSCKKENLDVIVVVLGATTKTMRTTDSIKVLNYIFNNYSNINIESTIKSSYEYSKNHFINNIKIRKTTDSAVLKLEDLGNTIFPLSKNELSKLKVETYFLNSLEAPIKEDTKIGFLTIKIDDEILKKLDIYVKSKIEKKNFRIYYQELVKNIFNFL